jgi:flagellar biosynthetic protein FlhB
MTDVEQSRSEQATPFKLAKARERGVVARGVDLGFLTALAAFCAFAWIEGAQVRAQIAGAAARALVSAPTVAGGPNAILAVTGQVMTTAMRPLAFMAGLIFLVVLAFEIVQTGGVVFSAKPLSPDFNRLNPATNLKRFTSPRLWVELAKNIIKLASYVAIAGWVVWSARRLDAGAIASGQDLARTLAQMALRMVMLFVAAAVVFAGIDQLISRRDFASRMKMSRREVRRELRDREGDPRLKQRRKQLHREFVKLSKSLRNIRDADVLVTNPVHFAVALKYDPKTMLAPVVVSRGAHAFAQRLRRLAFVYGLTIIEDPPLARELYRRTDIDGPIPEAQYRAVADIYLKIRARKMQAAKGTADA